MTSLSPISERAGGGAQWEEEREEKGRERDTQTSDRSRRSFLFQSGTQKETLGRGVSGLCQEELPGVASGNYNDTVMATSPHAGRERRRPSA